MVTAPIPNSGASITFDRLPLVDIRVRGSLTIESYRDVLRKLAARLREEKPPFTLCVDMREFNPLTVSAKERKQASEEWHVDRELWLRVIVGEARVVHNPLTRGLLTAIDWLTSTGKWPCKQFATMHDAEEWLQRRYEAALQPKR